MRSLLLLFLSGIFISSCSNEFDGTDGIKTIYFPNSELIKQVVNYKDGKRIGELREYYRNGNLKIKQYYKNDTLTDSCMMYYENGNIQLIQFIKDKKKEGSWKKFNEQGNTNLDLHKLASETAQPLLVGNNVKKLYVAVPPEKERIDIAKQISDLELNISKLKEKSLNQIKLLKEYRQSIIHECVTGKKQVADIAVEKEIKRAMA